MNGRDILACLARADDRVVSVEGFRIIEHETHFERVTTPGQTGGGRPWCMSFPDAWHHHYLWHRSFWSLVDKGLLEEWACTLGGAVLFRMTDKGRSMAGQ